MRYTPKNWEKRSISTYFLLRAAKNWENVVFPPIFCCEQQKTGKNVVFPPIFCCEQQKIDCHAKATASPKSNATKS
jgi:hypothetical protein